MDDVAAKIAAEIASRHGRIGPAVAPPLNVPPTPSAVVATLAGELAESAMRVDQLRREHFALGTALAEEEQWFSRLFQEVGAACVQINNEAREH